MTGVQTCALPIYASGAGDLGLDQGTADVLANDATSIAAKRQLGWAPATPVASALTNVVLDFTNVMGMA